MFSLYFGLNGINKSYIWFGGYSHNFLRGFVTGGAKMNNEEIDKQIHWIDIPVLEEEWIVPLTSWSLTNGEEENLNFVSTTMRHKG